MNSKEARNASIGLFELDFQDQGDIMEEDHLKMIYNDFSGYLIHSYLEENFYGKKNCRLPIKEEVTKLHPVCKVKMENTVFTVNRQFPP